MARLVLLLLFVFILSTNAQLYFSGYGFIWDQSKQNLYSNAPSSYQPTLFGNRVSLRDMSTMINQMRRRRMDYN
ncbi:hypothetical protein QR680_015950 [Steinernema hermaphroditum]|uniref:Uncharacterized protein n=1 Tax=Steinernema hermaphroditum TaxID=289476 RepID=A0AA39HAG6_9BILA|nr:hypothetical protein QR680_015950 [Steinernema hermaphroditum]